MSYKSNKRSKRRVSGDAQTLCSILPSVGKNLHIDRKIQEWSVLSLWDTVVPVAFKGQSRAERLVSRSGQTILKAIASNSAVAAELTFYLITIQNELNRYARQTGIEIHQIDLKVKQ